MFLVIACTIATVAGISGADDQQQIQTHCQRECMRKTVNERSAECLQLSSRRVNISDSNCCDWIGVTCLNQLILGIMWDGGTSVKIQSLAWLPASLVVVKIPGKWIRTNLETRLLPKKLRYVNFSRCGLYGPLELRDLPVALEELQLCKNNFTGEIRLTSLPPRMRIIDLERNEITRAFVSNDRLPGSLEKVDLFSTNGPRLVCLDEEEADRRIHLDKLYPKPRVY
ncbi:hypothetical protein XU18_4272 [Perkinsela sp. CCAP 1560/4]|nr:hypothetical protein XU18_4272 [Perkinsela sp. CCAP 1560/4]|eukprot:KNH04502.1 hypothetical protein XU18_4272 [Perkinsela sp. CCAP 1560/4]